ncbi:MAG: adenylosuccinate lyase, partial [Betaproteobacteria bacterium]|nr:adenylosuccinate lyase [Betaproteobacteria bacterium]
IQTVMRRYGLPEPYEKLKALTRGRGINEESLRDFVSGLSLPQSDKQWLIKLAPSTYLGLAGILARDELEKS